MRVYIVMEDARKGSVRIPLSRRELASVCNLTYGIRGRTWRGLRQDGLDKPLNSLIRKFQRIVMEAVHRSRVHHRRSRSRRIKPSDLDGGP